MHTRMEKLGRAREGAGPECGGAHAYVTSLYNMDIAPLGLDFYYIKMIRK